jgi:hypothetical protein
MNCEFCDGSINPSTNACSACGAVQSTPAAPVAASAPAPTAGPTVAQTGAVKTREVGGFVGLYIVTFGLYALYLLGSTWPEQYNQLLGEKRYNQTKITLLYICTCGIAIFYFAWKFISDLDEIAARLNLPANPNASHMRFGFIGWFIPYVSAIAVPWHLWQIQKELNRLAAVHNAKQLA